MGPSRQFQNMKDPKRRTASILFVVSMIMTLVCVYVIKSALLSIVFIIIQFGSYVWYVLSYIPYGREIAGSIGKKLIS